MSEADSLQRLEDLAAITSLMNEYCLTMEVDDFEEWLDLFTPDSVYQVFRQELHGRDEIRDMLSQAPHGVHMGGPLRIELDGDTAETIQNYYFIGEDPATSNAGWYYRTAVRTDAGWKISKTRIKMQKPKPAESK